MCAPHLRPISFNFMHFLPENRMCAPPFVTKQCPPHLENPGSATAIKILSLKQLPNSRAIVVFGISSICNLSHQTIAQ